MMGTGQYVLDEHGQPREEPDVLTWARWFQRADRQVACTPLSETAYVSTVFLGLDHQFGDGPPVLWETMAFGMLAGDERQYTSREDAIVGHEQVVAELRTLYP